MKAYAATNVGNYRPINEDSFYLPQLGENFCAVADGMGGHLAGEIASAMAVEIFAREMRERTLRVDSCMRRAVEQANAAILAESRASAEKRGMGTTFTALCIHENIAHIAHVGDSRAYLLRNGAIMRLTTDHTLVEELLRSGIITAKEAQTHPQRNIITRALGTADEIDIDLIRLEAFEKDVFLLCSDGLSNHIDETDMARILSGDASWQEKTDALVDTALKNGGTDNITAVICVFGEDKA